MARVRPGVEEVWASLEPSRALMREDLPTLERTEKAGDLGGVVGAALRGEVRGVGRGEKEDGGEAHLVEFTRLMVLGRRTTPTADSLRGSFDFAALRSG